MIVTIDGPAGSGKSTVAKQVADRLGWMYLDTGATYRCAALLAYRNGIGLQEAEKIAKLLEGANISFGESSSERIVLLDGEDVTSEIRSEAISELASKLATDRGIRRALEKKQRQIASQYDNVITEGRDQGSVVFSDAELKIYMEAEPEERAKRRYKQLAEQGRAEPYDKILKAIIERDNRDKTRSISPLIVPEDAVIIDTTNLTIEEVIEKIINLIEERQNCSKEVSE